MDRQPPIIPTAAPEGAPVEITLVPNTSPTRRHGVGARIAGVGLTVLAVVGGGAALANRSGAPRQVETVAGWYPVNEHDSTKCLNPETGEWEVVVSADSSEATNPANGYDSRMNLVVGSVDAAPLNQMGVAAGPVMDKEGKPVLDDKGIPKHTSAVLKLTFGRDTKKVAIDVVAKYPADSYTGEDDHIKVVAEAPADACEPVPTTQATVPPTEAPKPTEPTVATTTGITGKVVPATTTTTTTTTTTAVPKITEETVARKATS